MKLFALGAIALMDAALPAAAADRMPAKLVGNWCMDRSNQRQVAAIAIVLPSVALRHRGCSR
jgi:hypothetical protein